MYREGVADVKRVFNNVSVAASGTTTSNWYKLPEHFIAHGVNGRLSDAGTINISYTLAAVPDDAFGVGQGNVLASATAAANSPFLRSMTVRPSGWVKFTVTETGGANGIEITMYFVQTGRGA